MQAPPRPNDYFESVPVPSICDGSDPHADYLIAHQSRTLVTVQWALQRGQVVPLRNTRLFDCGYSVLAEVLSGRIELEPDTLPAWTAPHVIVLRENTTLTCVSSAATVQFIVASPLYVPGLRLRYTALPLPRFPLVCGDVQLRPMRQHEAVAVLSLCVTDEQERYVGTVADALATMAFSYPARELIVWYGDAPVGWMTYSYAPLCKRVPIHRFAIAHQVQRRGFGAKALRAFFAYVRDMRRFECGADNNDELVFELRVAELNVGGRRFYEAQGFEVTSHDSSSEHVTMQAVRTN